MQITKEQTELALFDIFLHDFANQVTIVTLQYNVLQSPMMEAKEIEEHISHMHESIQQMQTLIASFRDYLSDK